MARKGLKTPKFSVKKQPLKDIEEFGCPAIRKKDGKYFIDKNFCWGCSVCKQLYPDKIEVAK
jgi:TPP-dependent indolepyruvate ferredoxin oxidoreductase alpha subunit